MANVSNVNTFRGVLMGNLSISSKNSTFPQLGGYTLCVMEQSDYISVGFGKALYSYRRKAGLSQAAVAEHMGVSQRTVSAWEARDEPPDDPLALWELAELLGTTPDDLREGRVRVGTRGRTFDEYLDELVAAEALEGVDMQLVKELLRIVTELSPEDRRELVDFGEWRRARGGKAPGRQVQRKTPGKAETSGGVDEDEDEQG